MRLTFRNIFFHGAVIFRGPLPKQDAQLENTCFKRATQNPPRTDNARQVIKPNESCIIWGSATEPQIINFHFKSRVCALLRESKLVSLLFPWADQPMDKFMETCSHNTFSHVSTVPVQSPYSPRTVPVTVPVGIYHSPRGFPYRRGGQGQDLPFLYTKTTGTVVNSNGDCHGDCTGTVRGLHGDCRNVGNQHHISEYRLISYDVVLWRHKIASVHVNIFDGVAFLDAAKFTG